MSTDPKAAAAPEPQPVAWDVYDPAWYLKTVRHQIEVDEYSNLGYRIVPLYTHPAERVAALEAELAKVKAERDAALADAERYGWIRAVATPINVIWLDGKTDPTLALHELDAAIDAARKEGDK